MEDGFTKMLRLRTKITDIAIGVLILRKHRKKEGIFSKGIFDEVKLLTDQGFIPQDDDKPKEFSGGGLHKKLAYWTDSKKWLERETIKEQQARSGNEGKRRYLKVTPEGEKSIHNMIIDFKNQYPEIIRFLEKYDEDVNE